MFSYLYFEELDSTNTYLKTHYQELASGTVVYTDHQTQGRGRLGRDWKDDKKSLVFSLLLKDNLNPKRTSLLALLSGTSMAKTIEEEGIPVQLKWPNDVMVNEKKVCGILVEGISQGEKPEAIIIGIGLNLNDTEFPSDLKNKAISLYQATGKTFDKKEMLDKFLKNFESFYQGYRKGNDEFLSYFQSHSYLQGKEVYLNYYGENLKATVVGITFEGKLKVKINGEEKELESGEVTLEENYR